MPKKTPEELINEHNAMQNVPPYQPSGGATGETGGIKVRILRDASYANYLTMPKLSAQNLKKGDVVSFPTYYAEDIIAAGLAERVMAYSLDATLGAQELAEEYGIDLADVEGTGKEGRIIKADVQGLVEGKT